MQLLDYDETAMTVVAHHTDSRSAGTENFEHRPRVDLASAALHPRNPDVLRIALTCPGCGPIEIDVPLIGDSEAQEFHARVRRAKAPGGSRRPLDTYRQEVAADVRARGGEPRPVPRFVRPSEVPQ